MFIFLSASSGPQKCASCIQEGIYEEGISVLETSSVSKIACFVVCFFKVNSLMLLIPFVVSV